MFILELIFPTSEWSPPRRARRRRGFRPGALDHELEARLTLTHGVAAAVAAAHAQAAEIRVERARAQALHAQQAASTTVQPSRQQLVRNARALQRQAVLAVEAAQRAANPARWSGSASGRAAVGRALVTGAATATTTTPSTGTQAAVTSTHLGSLAFGLSRTVPLSNGLSAGSLAGSSIPFGNLSNAAAPGIGSGLSTAILSLNPSVGTVSLAGGGFANAGNVLGSPNAGLVSPGTNTSLLTGFSNGFNTGVGVPLG